MYTKRQYQSSSVLSEYATYITIGSIIFVTIAIIPISCIIYTRIRKQKSSQVSHPLPMNNLIVENMPRSSEGRERQSNRQTLSQVTRASRRQDKLGGRSVDTLPLYSQNNNNIVINNTHSSAALETMASTLPSTIEVDETVDTPPTYSQVSDRV